MPTIDCRLLRYNKKFPGHYLSASYFVFFTASLSCNQLITDCRMQFPSQFSFNNS
ncbi:hypothetical protein KsCSTR_12220 [Candidatus Kuenenia stuttgartiensis]|uniref:Uncharacterized protein n=1 Tax=Kuenenia stuttgartiensis TaxID=174633 RepID=Q1PY87_KUEST|nr:hypothetical protein KsCSTR_12220 [Candidatus Kuenenia stuttgartiensis]CAJ72049.1 unknown protein [Candidatus Kuenenia stuttgartiensis]